MNNQIFETIVPETRNGRWARPQATMNAKGWIKLNRVAFELLGEPDRVHVLYGRAGKTIALKASDARDYNSHMCVAHGKHGRHGGRLIRVYGLIAALEGDIFTCVRFTNVRLDENNRLILDLVTAVPAFNGQRIGIYQKWLDKRREHTNETAKAARARRLAAQAAKEAREPISQAYTPPKSKRVFSF